MSKALDFLLGTVVLGGLAVLVVWILVRWWKNSEDRQELATRWGLTLLDLLFLGFVAVPLVLRGGYAGAFGGIPMTAVGGLVLAIIWTPGITDYFGRKFGNLYDGGNVAPEVRPLYSIAIAKRKRGMYREAAAEVQRQLEEFPNDLEGVLLLAEIQADDLHNVEAARAALERYANQPDRSPKNAAFALTRLADYVLRYQHDGPGARELFERIVERYPASEEAYLAHQRIAHLPAPEMLDGRAAQPSLSVPEADPHLGTRKGPITLEQHFDDPVQRAAALVQQLEQYPMDSQAREDLAVLYARELQRLDLAIDQVEQLIAQENAPAKQVAKWLNLMADLHVREGADAVRARESLERIIALYPNSPAAENARRRISTLKLEANAKKQSQAVKLGSYPQKLGLRGGATAPE